MDQEQYRWAMTDAQVIFVQLALWAGWTLAAVFAVLWLRARSDLKVAETAAGWRDELRDRSQK